MLLLLLLLLLLHGAVGKLLLLYHMMLTQTIGLAISRGEFGWVWEKPFETNESYLYMGGSSINRDRTRALSQEARTRVL
eukprot:COSAG02_NODE_8344_length_2604_cov_25.631521_2_plen_79_part_00